MTCSACSNNWALSLQWGKTRIALSFFLAFGVRNSVQNLKRRFLSYCSQRSVLVKGPTNVVNFVDGPNRPYGSTRTLENLPAKEWCRRYIPLILFAYDMLGRL